jgi:cell division protein ZapA
MSQTAVTISINNRKLKIACPTGEESALIASSKDLDARLTSLLNKGNCASLEQALLMTALNLSNELLKLRKEINDDRAVTEEKIALLQSTIEQALSVQSVKRA